MQNTIGHRLRTLPWWLRLVALLSVLALFAAGCGDDDDGDDGAGGTEDTTEEDTPVAGGEATALLFSEIGTLDPVSSTGSGGSDAQRFFPIYGAIVTYESEKNEAIPYFAESLEPNADFSQWTLKLKDGVTFSDNTPYNAEAIKVNWERLKNPANRSPSLGIALTLANLEVVDPLTLRITLTKPNAHFPNSVSRFGGMNYIASPAAINAKADLVNNPVGAGSFVMKQWIRDDRMVLERSPTALEEFKPYLDRVVLRVVGDEQQRIDTFTSGAAEAFYTSTQASVDTAEDQGAAGYASVTVGTGQTFVFNTSKPPFNDPRVRRAFVVGIDRKALDEVVFGPGAIPATNFSRKDSPWFTAKGKIPDYDKAEAQKLFSEAATALGGTVRINLQGFQQSLDQRRVEFVQTSLNQYEGVEVSVKINDSPTSIGNVLRGDYEVSSWGFPHLDPDPGVYNAMRTGLPTNYSKYSNPEVDEALDAARISDDDDERAALYEVAFEAAAKDLPFFPYVDTTNGFVYAKKLKGTKVWEDGILRFDLLWLDEG